MTNHCMASFTVDDITELRNELRNGRYYALRCEQAAQDKIALDGIQADRQHMEQWILKLDWLIIQLNQAARVLPPAE